MRSDSPIAAVGSRSPPGPNPAQKSAQIPAGTPAGMPPISPSRSRTPGAASGRKICRGTARSGLDRSGDDGVGGWLDSRLPFLRNIGWGVRDALALTVGTIGAIAILVNALFLQSGPHPAPLFKASLSPVAPGEATNTV